MATEVLTQQVVFWPEPECWYKDRLPGHAKKSERVEWFDIDHNPTDSLGNVGMIFGYRGRKDPHYLAGTVTVDGKPASRNIWILNRFTFEIMSSTTSDPVTGKWSVRGLAPTEPRSILVLATDSPGDYNAEVADVITAVATWKDPNAPTGEEVEVPE